jgi:predicted GNAT superfamily acetyltransferase
LKKARGRTTCVRPLVRSLDFAGMETDDPWRLARAAAERSGLTLRPLGGLEDTQRVGRVIERVWGAEAMPPSLLRAFQRAGGTLHGAEAEGELVGFVLGFLGWAEGVHMHSHMLAVVPERESRGAGYALKLAQRADCLDRGVEEVRWTFDPLVARNARFNLTRLGAVATAFLPGFYGEMPDRLNRGDRSDRFEVRWRLRSPHVERVLGGKADVQPVGRHSLLELEGPSEAPRPVETGAAVQGPALVAVPDDFLALRTLAPDLGAQWREASSRAFAACFEAGLVATWIGPDGRYVFTHPGESPA